MTIAKGGDGYECMCDECCSIMDETAPTYGGMISLVLRSAWVPEKDDATGEWTHRCPNCIPKWNETPLQRAQRMFGD